MYYDVSIVFDSFYSIPLKRVLMMKFIDRVEVYAISSLIVRDF